MTIITIFDSNLHVMSCYAMPFYGMVSAVAVNVVKKDGMSHHHRNYVQQYETM